MEIEGYRQYASEMLYQDESFLDDLRTKHGDKGLDILKDLEARAIKKAEEIASGLDDEDQILEKIGEYIQELKRESLT